MDMLWWMGVQALWTVQAVVWTLILITGISVWAWCWIDDKKMKHDHIFKYLGLFKGKQDYEFWIEVWLFGGFAVAFGVLLWPLVAVIVSIIGLLHLLRWIR